MNKVIQEGSMNQDLYEVSQMIVDETIAKKMTEILSQKLEQTLLEAIAKKNGQQKTADKEEQEKRAAELRTQGRKGCKAPRINMAFTTENYDFLKRESKKNGETITQFANRMIQDAKIYYFARKRGLIE